MIFSILAWFKDVCERFEQLFFVQMFYWDQHYVALTVCKDLWGGWCRLSSLSCSVHYCPLPPALLRVRWPTNITAILFTFCISRLLRSSYCFQHGGPWWCLPIEGFYKFWLNFVQWKFIKGRLGGSKTWGNLLWWLHLYQVRF